MAAVLAKGDWVTLRTFSSTAAEATSVAAGATFLEMGGAGKSIEVRGRWGSETSPLTTATTNPTGVTLAIWRKRGSTVDKVGTIFFTVTSNAVVAREPAIFDFDGSLGYATVESFVAGTVPVLIGIVEARVVE